MFALIQHQQIESLDFTSLGFWPNSNSNGYAYYHRVDRVNGGDENATHTTGMGKKQKFWYH